MNIAGVTPGARTPSARVHQMAAPLSPPAEAPVSVPVWAWVVAAVSVAAAYVLTMENGALLGQTAGNVHEFFHDARHFLGVPCH